MIKNIIFDCSDTLLHFELNKKTAEWLGGDVDGAVRVHKLTYGHPAFARYCMGTLDYESAKEMVLSSVSDADRDICERHMEHRSRHYTPIDGMPELLKTLKQKGYRLYVLSDFPDYFEDVKERFDFFELFDGLCVSYEAHEGKGNGRLFDVVIERFELDPAECVFVDDVERNAIMSETYGMNGIAFVSAADTVEKLRSLGIEL